MHLGMSGSLAFAERVPAPGRTTTSTWSPGGARCASPIRAASAPWSGRRRARERRRRQAARQARPRAVRSALRRRRICMPRCASARCRSSRRCWAARSSSAPATSTPAKRCSRPASIRARAATASAGRAPSAWPPAVRATLARAVELGGSTLRDFRDAHGAAGEFQLEARVYGRAGEQCAALRRHGAPHRPGRRGRPSSAPAASAADRSRVRGQVTACSEPGERAKRPAPAVVSRCFGTPCARVPALGCSAPFARLLDDPFLRDQSRRPRRVARRPRPNASTALARFLAEHDLAQGAAGEQIASLRERLGNEKLVVAFVAEFSRGKSELINAIFFADTGRRILPATPGRTTMCPVELGWTERRAGLARPAADRDPARGPLARRAAHPAARLAPHRAADRRPGPARPSRCSR